MKFINRLCTVPVRKADHEFDDTESRNSIITCLLACMILLAAPGISGQANARLFIKEKTKTYSVSGKNGKQVQAKLGRGGPWKLRRRHAIAATQRVLDFNNIKFAKRGNKCVIVKKDIHLTLTYFYPRWTNKKFASKKSQQLWARFLAELVRHEKVHGKFFITTARQIDKDLERISRKTYRSCRSMSTAVKKQLTKAFKKGQVKHIAFDRREKRPAAKVRRIEKAFYKSR